MANANLRDLILQAVNRVVARSGLIGTTIDAVAAEAGVSKGGVLYHFPSKRELLLGMVERYETDFFRRHAEVLQELPESPYRKLKAIAIVMLNDLDATRDAIPNFATVLDDPDVRAKVGEFKRVVYEDASRDIDNPVVGAMIMYIIDGMWMDVQFEPNVVSKDIRDAATREILARIDSLGK